MSPVITNGQKQNGDVILIAQESVSPNGGLQHVHECAVYGNGTHWQACRCWKNSHCHIQLVTTREFDTRSHQGVLPSSNTFMHYCMCCRCSHMVHLSKHFKGQAMCQPMQCHSKPVLRCNWASHHGRLICKSLPGLRYKKFECAHINTVRPNLTFV